MRVPRLLAAAAGAALLASGAARGEEILAGFTRAVSDQASTGVVGLHSCEGQSDGGFWLDTLVVTEEIQIAMEEAVLAGRGVFIRFEVISLGIVLGHGTSYYRAAIQVSCGTDTACRSISETGGAPPNFADITVHTLRLPSSIIFLTPGETISLQGFAVGKVHPGGCENTDQAAIDVQVGMPVLLTADLSPIP